MTAGSPSASRLEPGRRNGPSPHRAVVTGAGLVTARGVGRDGWWAAATGPDTDALRATDSPKIRAGIPAPPDRARLVPWRLDVEKDMPRSALRKISDHARLVTTAAWMVLEQESGRSADERDDLGILMATAFGNSAYHLEYHEALRRKGVEGASALLFSQSVFNAAGGHIGASFGLRGSNLTFVGGETVGLEAITRAGTRVRVGSDRALLAGGGEQYDAMVHASLEGAGLLRGSLADGILTEGAALLLVERLEDAAHRGAVPLAELAGAGHARGGGPVQDAFERAADRALAAAGIERGAPGLVVCCPPANAEATSHAEAAAGLVPEGAALALPTIGLGEGFAFTSALAAATAAEALHRGVVPPTRFRGAVPAWAAGRCVEAAVARPMEHVLVVASSAHGSVTALVLSRVPSDPAQETPAR